MRSKTQCPVNIKPIIIIIIIIIFFFFLLPLLFLIFFILRPNLSPLSSSSSSYITQTTSLSASSILQGDDDDESSSSSSTHNNCPENPPSSSTTCNKISPSLAKALVHYATSNVTPQQTLNEVSVSMRVLAKKSPCNFLVFGLGYDSLMWVGLNHGGRTLFLEEDAGWIRQIQGKFPELEAFHVYYDTKVTEAEKLLEVGKEDRCKAVMDPRDSECELAMKGLPREVYETEWDVIMVDAPTGWHEAAPGRMKAIYTAGLMGRNRESGESDVFVHDVDRRVEDTFSKEFLCEGYLVEEEGRIRHFTIPSHKARLGRPFCPP